MDFPRVRQRWFCGVLAPVPFIPDPRLPTSADLAASAAGCQTPVLLWCIDHTFTITALAGQLLPLVTAVQVGSYLLDQPLEPDARRQLIHAAIGALLGQVMPYEITAYGQRWRTTLAPVLCPEDGNRVLGALGNSYRITADVPEPGSEPLGYFASVVECEDCHVGDLITVGSQGLISRHGTMTATRFDELLARGWLMPCDPAELARTGVPGRATAPAACGRAPRRPLRLVTG
jgi:hypothetical protein